MKKTKQFTLIELLVVVAIIGILASLLMPSLSKSRKKARGVVCLNQQKQIGLAIFLYSGDNDNYFPFADDRDGSSYAYDDLISDYMSLEWEDNHKAMDEIPTAIYPLKNNPFLCPNDDLPSRNSVRHRRTYGLNRARINGLGFVGIAWVVGQANRSTNWGTRGSVKISDVEDHSGTIALTEEVYDLNAVGRSNNRDVIDGPYDQELYSDGLHGQQRFNYLFTDGHAKVLSHTATVGSGDYNSPRGMWTRYKGD